MAFPFPRRTGECKRTRFGLSLAIFATMMLVPSMLPSSEIIISYDLEKDLTAASTSSIHFSICAASLYAGSRIEISFSVGSLFKRNSTSPNRENKWFFAINELRIFLKIIIAAFFRLSQTLFRCSSSILFLKRGR